MPHFPVETSLSTGAALVALVDASGAQAPQPPVVIASALKYNKSLKQDHFAGEIIFMRNWWFKLR